MLCSLMSMQNAALPQETDAYGQTRAPRVGFYAGSFDPPTLGHGDVILRALSLCDTLIIAVGVNPAKPSALLSSDERMDLLALVCADILSDLGLPSHMVRVLAFKGLAVKAAQHAGAHFLVRGLRNGSDLDSEMALAGMNEELARHDGYAIETVFVPTSPKFRMITATLVRQIVLMGGDPAPFVDARVRESLLARRKAQHTSEYAQKETC